MFVISQAMPPVLHVYARKPLEDRWGTTNTHLNVKPKGLFIIYFQGGWRFLILGKTSKRT